MNSTPRTATRGGNKSKSELGSGKGHKSDNKRDGPKNNDTSKAQSSSERIAQITESITDESSLKKNIAQIMNVIDTTEDAAMTALHDCDNDVNRAVSMLLEGNAHGEWETSGKKKKNRQNSTTKGEATGERGVTDADGEDADVQPLAANQDRERSRGRGGSSRLRGRGANDNRGPGRGRDNKENEGAGGEEGFRGVRGDGFRRGGRGISNGPGGRGGRGGRGGGGRLGSRMFQGRDGRDKSESDRFPSTIDTWNPSGPQDSNEKPLKMETWGDSFPAAEDWDNEEYTGSLADSKVFTPSALETVSSAAETHDETANQDILSMATSAGPDFQSAALPSGSLPVGVGTLSTAQAQYLSQLTQQSAENLKVNAAAAASYGQSETLKSAVGIGSSGSYAQSASYSQTGQYGQVTYAPATYGTTVAAYSASTGYAATSATSNAYSSGSSAFAATAAGYQTSNNSSFGVYPSSGGSYSYDGANTTSDATAPTAQPTRAKTQRPRVPPPSKIPSSAVEMPDDSISANVSSLDVQFGCLEFISDGSSFDAGAEQNNKFPQAPPTSSVAATEIVSSGAPAAGLDTTANQQASLNAYTAAKTASASSSQQASLVGGLTSKGLSNSETLSIQSSGDHKSSFTQSSRAASSTSGLDLTKTDVGSLSYASAPSAANYTTYQNQKSSSSVYQPTSYSASSYTAAQTTYASAVPISYTAAAYSSQPSINNSFPSSSYTQQPNATNYTASTGAYPSANSFQNTSQNYQSGTSSVYGAALSSGYSAGSGYQNNYSAASSASTKLNSGLSTTKESQEYGSSTTSSISSTTSTTSSLLSSATTPQAVSTTTSKISTGAMKNSIVPSLHPQMMGAPQYIMSSASMPFYHQTPMYGFEDMQLQLQRIPHVPAGYFDMSAYSGAPTSLATGRDSLPNVAYTTVADGRYSTRGDNNASPVPSTLSQQTATAHQQPMMNHPSFPPGYTYVYNAVPGNFQYGAPIFPVPSAGNAHGASSNQYAKPATYGSSYGSNYDGLSQTADYTKSAYGVKSGVGGASVSSATTASDLYGKAHTALGKVNSYDKQGFHSATPPPFNLAAGQGTGIAASGAYPPQLYMAMPPHQQHHSTQLIPSHLQDSTNSSGQRSQSAAQPNKSGNKQSYNPYWTQN